MSTLFWVTRIGEPGHRLSSALRDLGCAVVCAPLFECVLLPTVDTDYRAYSAVVFFSPFAVTASSMGVFSQEALLFAVGSGTAAAVLQQRGRSALYPTEGSGAEALWSLPFFQQKAFIAHRWLLVRGEGGRSFFYNALRSFSADVSEWLCYRRISAVVLPQEVTAYDGQYVVCVITSTDSLRCLKQLLASHSGVFKQWVLLCCHERIWASAQSDMPWARSYLCSFEQEDIVSLAISRPWEQA